MFNVLPSVPTQLNGILTVYSKRTFRCSNRIRMTTIVNQIDHQLINLSTNEKSQNPTKLGHASGSANPTLGFATTNRHIRSVLMHPMCLPLLIYLNDVPSESYPDQIHHHHHHLAYIRDALEGCQKRCDDDDDTIHRNHVFAATVSDWQGDSEKDLTTKLKTNMEMLKLGIAHVSTHGEKNVGIKGNHGRVDFLFNQENSPSVVAMFEFAIDHGIWWRKQDQLLNYLKILQDNPAGNDKFDGPVLLSVITINKGKDHHGHFKQTPFSDVENLTKQQTLDKLTLKIKSITENKPDIAQIPLEARFGVFLCTPKGDDDFRIALLWRHDATTLKDASMQFGKVLYAVRLCSYLREYCTKNQETIKHEYLGPNCCKFGNLVRLNPLILIVLF